VAFVDRTTGSRLLVSILLSIVGVPGGNADGFPSWTRSAINLPASGTRFSWRHDVDGDGKRDLLIVSGDRLLIFQQSTGGEFSSDPTRSVKIPPDFPVVVPTREQHGAPSLLILLGPGGIAELEAPLGSDPGFIPLVPRLERSFDITTGTTPMLADLAVDLNGDGVDELIIPFQDQLEILALGPNRIWELRDALNLPTRSIRMASILPGVTALGARYFESVRLRSNPVLQPVAASDAGANFLTFGTASALPRILLVDWFGHRRIDVVTPTMVWQQGESGGFQPIRIPGSLQIRWSESALQNQLRCQVNLADFNGDNRLDTFQLETVDNSISPRTELEVFFARPDRTYGSRPDAVLRTRDISLSGLPALGDLDEDGVPDVCLPHLDLQASSASSQFRSFLKEGLQGELRFYCFDRERLRFPDAPTAAVPLTVNYEMFGAAQLFRPLYAFHRDLDGDRRPDLVMKSSASTFAVYRNRGGRNGFDSRPFATMSVAPWNIADIEFVDLNADAVADIVATVYTPDSQRRLILALFVSR
jgi:hypothetical protein